jgi:hypothetical protein
VVFLRSIEHHSKEYKAAKKGRNKEEGYEVTGPIRAIATMTLMPTDNYFIRTPANSDSHPKSKHGQDKSNHYPAIE